MGDESSVRMECGPVVPVTHRCALDLPTGTGISVRVRWSATRCLGDVAWLISIGRQNNRAWRRVVGSVECNDPLVTEVVFEAADLAEVLPGGPLSLFVTREADSPKDTCLGSVFIEGVDVFALGETA